MFGLNNTTRTSSDFTVPAIKKSPTVSTVSSTNTTSTTTSSIDSSSALKHQQHQQQVKQAKKQLSSNPHLQRLQDEERRRRQQQREDEGEVRLNPSTGRPLRNTTPYGRHANDWLFGSVRVHKSIARRVQKVVGKKGAGSGSESGAESASEE